MKEAKGTISAAISRDRIRRKSHYDQFPGDARLSLTIGCARNSRALTANSLSWKSESKPDAPIRSEYTWPPWDIRSLAIRCTSCWRNPTGLLTRQALRFTPRTLVAPKFPPCGGDSLHAPEKWRDLGIFPALTGGAGKLSRPAKASVRAVDLPPHEFIHAKASESLALARLWI